MLLKNYTEVKLKEGNTRSSEQQEVTPLWQMFQININMGGLKGKGKKKKKKKENTPTPNPKSTNPVRYSIESYKGKLTVK